MHINNSFHTRDEIAEEIHAKLLADKLTLMAQWESSAKVGVSHFYIDNLLPEDIAQAIYNGFPKNTGKMALRKSLRELKFVAAQMNEHEKILEEALYAFQDPQIVKLIEEITGLKALEPDDLLYAGGISMMQKDHFLNPHLDNSHDKERERYRVLNLLYYVTPDWCVDNGGNLEVWPDGPTKPQTTIESKFNRLAVMITNDKSWHSVSKVKVDAIRCCVSNYYFSKYPANNQEYFHVTSFRGRPEQKFRDLLLRLDAALRMGVRKIFHKGVVETKHYYKK